jgi:hypothetical protein
MRAYFLDPEDSSLICGLKAAARRCWFGWVSRALSILRTVADCTCLGSKRPDAEPPQLDPDAAAALAWTGIFLGLFVAGVAYPLSAALLPFDVALAGALWFQAFLLNFQAEAGVVEAASRNRARAAGVVVLFLLLKLSIYRSFFPEEMAAALWLGTIVQASAPALLTSEGHPLHLIRALLPVTIGAAALAMLIPWPGAGMAIEEVLPRLRPLALALAGLILARLFVLAWIRERRLSGHPQLTFCGALPFEIATIGAYLFARYHHI